MNLGVDLRNASRMPKSAKGKNRVYLKLSILVYVNIPNDSDHGSFIYRCRQCPKIGRILLSLVYNSILF